MTIFADSFAAAMLIKSAAEKLHDDATAKLKAVSGDARGPFGLTPDHIKQSEAWRNAYAAERAAFDYLRKVNAFCTRKYSKEMRAARRAKAA